MRVRAFILSLVLASCVLSGAALAQDTADSPVDISVQTRGSALFDFTVVSSTATETRLHLTELEGTWRAASYPLLPTVSVDYFYYTFDVAVDAGYQVTGFNFDMTGSALVTVDPASSPTSPGRGNVDYFGVGLRANSASYMVLGQDSVNDMGPSPQALSAVISDQSFTGEFELNVGPAWFMTLVGGYSFNFEGLPMYRPTYADFTQSDAYLVIHTAPIAAVPEPASAAMLMLGAGICTMVRRRTRKNR